MNPPSHFLEKARESGEKHNSAKHLQDKSVARKSKSTCHECGQRGHWAGDPQCHGNRDTNFTTWPDDQSFLWNFRCSSVDVHIPVSLVVTGTVISTRLADSQELCRSVMENSEPSASKSDLGLGLFFVAGSDWGANYKSLLGDFGLKHEIDETREAERYKFGDSGTLVSSFRVTGRIFVAGQKGRIVSGKKRKLRLPANAVSESADESDFDRFDDLVLPSPERKTVFISIASGDEAEDGPDKEQEKSRPRGGVHAGGRDRRASTERELVQAVHAEWARELREVRKKFADACPRDARSSGSQRKVCRKQGGSCGQTTGQDGAGTTRRQRCRARSQSAGGPCESVEGREGACRQMVRRQRLRLQESPDRRNRLHPR